MGRFARQKIARRFSLDKAVEGYRAIIQEAVAKGGPRGVRCRTGAGSRARSER
jgi:hypothetical protein